MKKILLKLLLTIAMILTSTVTVFAEGSAIDAFEVTVSSVSKDVLLPNPPTNNASFGETLDPNKYEIGIYWYSIFDKDNNLLYVYQSEDGWMDGGEMKPLQTAPDLANATSIIEAFEVNNKDKVTNSFASEINISLNGGESLQKYIDVTKILVQGNTGYNINTTCDSVVIGVRHEFAPAVTIADILPGDFPSNHADGWINKGNAVTAISYVYDGKLYFQEKDNPYTIINDLLTTTALTKEGDNYTVNNNDGKVTFVMYCVPDLNYCSLKNIQVSNSSKTNLNGTYTPAPISEVNIEYYDFDFLKFTTKAPTVPTDAKYHFLDSYWITLLNGSTPVATLKGSEGVWVDPSTTTVTPVDPSKLSFDAASIYTNIVVNGPEYRFNPAAVVKANDKSVQYLDSTTQNQQDIINGKKEGYTIQSGNQSMLLCLMFKRYEIIEGKDAVINVDKNKDNILFTSIAEYNIFEKVLVDDEEIASTNYTVEDGSTKVILNAEYLKTLSSGKHTLTIVSKDGNASTYFTITRNPKPNPGYVVPKTGVE